MTTKVPLPTRPAPFHIALAILSLSVIIGSLSAIALGVFAPATVVSVNRLVKQPYTHKVTALASPMPTPVPTATPSPIPTESIPAFQRFLAATTTYQGQPEDTLSQLHLIIPRIKLTVPIVERGLEQGWMVVAPGTVVTHFTFSAYPGAIGNTVLYGHNESVFRHLDQLAINDQITIQTSQGDVRYKVRELRIVAPDQISVLNTTSTPVLTMITCYPFGIDTARLIVIADEVQG